MKQFVDTYVHIWNSTVCGLQRVAPTGSRVRNPRCSLNKQG